MAKKKTTKKKTEQSKAKATGLSTIESAIIELREVRVILDSDLAELYGVETKRLNEQVKRNAERFGEKYAFQLTKDEFDALRSQSATSKRAVADVASCGRNGTMWLMPGNCRHGRITAMFRDLGERREWARSNGKCFGRFSITLSLDWTSRLLLEPNDGPTRLPRLHTIQRQAKCGGDGFDTRSFVSRAAFAR